jgi:drug/metabolite transporter (DMT)-like permease
MAGSPGDGAADAGVSPTSRTRIGTPALAVGLVALWLCWGTSFPAMRVMVASLPPLLATGAIFTAAGLVLALTSPGALRGLTRRQVLTAAGVGGCLLLAQGAVAVAVQHVFASTAALLVAVIPLWVAVLAALTGHHPTAATVMRLVLGFAGVVIVLLAPGSGGRWSWWALVVVAAAASWAVGTLWASRATDLPPIRAATVIQLLCGGVVLLAAGLGTGQAAGVHACAVSPASWAAFGYLVLVDSLAGFRPLQPAAAQRTGVAGEHLRLRRARGRLPRRCPRAR